MLTRIGEFLEANLRVRESDLQGSDRFTRESAISFLTIGGRVRAR